MPGAEHATLHLLLPGARVQPVPLQAPWSALADLQAFLAGRAPAALPNRVVRGVLGLGHHALPPGNRDLYVLSVEDWRAFRASLPAAELALLEVDAALDRTRAARGLVLHFPHAPAPEPARPPAPDSGAPPPPPPAPEGT